MDEKHNHFQSESKLNSSEIKQDGKGGHNRSKNPHFSIVSVNNELMKKVLLNLNHIHTGCLKFADLLSSFIQHVII